MNTAPAFNTAKMLTTASAHVVEIDRHSIAARDGVSLQGGGETLRTSVDLTVGVFAGIAHQRDTVRSLARVLLQPLV